MQAPLSGVLQYAHRPSNKNTTCRPQTILYQQQFQATLLKLQLCLLLPSSRLPRRLTKLPPVQNRAHATFARRTRVKSGNSSAFCFVMANQKMADSAIAKHTFGEMPILLSKMSRCWELCLRSIKHLTASFLFYL